MKKGIKTLLLITLLCLCKNTSALSRQDSIRIASNIADLANAFEVVKSQSEVRTSMNYALAWYSLEPYYFVTLDTL